MSYCSNSKKKQTLKQEKSRRDNAENTIFVATADSNSLKLNIIIYLKKASC